MSDMDATPGFFGKLKKDPIPAIGELNLQYKIQMFTNRNLL